MIEVKNVVKQYGDHLAVDHLSFQVEKGQVYGFLGPNGAGKSTTMNMITGYLASDEGTVVINGHDILKEPEEAKKCIGYLPEIPPLYVDMTVKEYLTFVAGLKGVPKTEVKNCLEDIMDKTFLVDVSNRLIKNLSKGYKQRVGLAQALIGDPEILILDEPTVGLDPKQIIEIRELIMHLAEKHTIILSSHILSEVSAICDKIMIISHGKLVACDTPEGLSKSVTGSTTLKIEVLDPERKASECIREKFGKNVAIKAEQNVSINDKNVWSATLEISGDEDIREELFYLLAQEKCPLLQLTHTKMSLEDIFLELTENEAADAKASEESDVENVKEDSKNVDTAEATEDADTQGEEVEHEGDL